MLTLREFITTSENVKRIDSAVWDALIAAIRELRPEFAQALDILTCKRTEQRLLVGNDARTTRLIEHRDALGLSLEIAGLNRSPSLNSLDLSGVEEAKSVLDLLDSEPIQEQDAIRHDQQIFKGLLTKSMTHRSFIDHYDRSVRIYVYDKKPLETVLGVDLLIFQQSFKSFILIQYKMMHQIRGKYGNSWSYLVDQQLEKLSFPRNFVFHG